MVQFKTFVIFLIVSSLFTISCNCDGVLCAPCPPTAPDQALITFDTSASGFTRSEIMETQLIKIYGSGASDTSPVYRFSNPKLNSWDTLYAFDLLNYSHVDSAVTTTLHFTSGNQIIFQNMDIIDVTPINNEKDCCEPCQKFELGSIKIDDSNYRRAQLPIIVKK
jgi:hypothetical protein